MKLQSDKGIVIAIGIVAFFLIVMGLLNKRSSATVSLGSTTAGGAGGMNPVIIGQQYPNSSGIYQGLSNQGSISQAQAQVGIAAQQANAAINQSWAGVATAGLGVLGNIFGGDTSSE